MNRAQKVAWCNFAGSFLSLALIGLLGWFLLSGPTAAKMGLVRTTVLVLSGTMVLLFFVTFTLVLRRKQSPAEPDADERDQLISKKAVQVSFVSMCILIFIATAVPMWLYGLDSAIPTVALPLINLSVILAALMIYNAVILILYKLEGGAA